MALDYKKLRESVDRSWRTMRAFRENQKSTLKRYLGGWYGGGYGKFLVKDRQVHPFVTLFTDTLVRHLAAKNPRVMVRAERLEYSWTALGLEAAINRAIERFKLVQVIREFAFELVTAPMACFLVGPNHYVGRDSQTDSELYEVSVDNIPFADLILDMGAPNVRRLSYIGHRHCLPLEVVQSNRNYSSQARKKIQPSGGNWRNIGERPLRELSTDKSLDEYRFEEYVDLLTVYLPDYGRWITFVDDMDDLVLEESDWTGPDMGPYVLAKRQDVSGQILGLPATSVIVDHHDTLNELANKNLRRSLDSKDLGIGRGGGESDLKAIARARDLELFTLANPQSIQWMKVGGADPNILSLETAVSNLANYYAGNIESIGGLGPQSGTLGQDQMLAAAASVTVQDLQARQVEAVRSVCEQIGEYVWKDDINRIPVALQIPGVRDPVFVEFGTPEAPRAGDYRDYDLTVHPYSMQDQTPETVLAKLVMILNQVVIPTMPAAQAEGKSLRVSALMEEIGRLTNMPWVADLLGFSARAGVPDDQESAPKPSATSRTYTRVNRSGNTRSAQREALIAKMSGQGMTAEQNGQANKRVG